MKRTYSQSIIIFLICLFCFSGCQKNNPKLSNTPVALKDTADISNTDNLTEEENEAIDSASVPPFPEGTKLDDFNKINDIPQQKIGPKVNSLNADQSNVASVKANLINALINDANSLSKLKSLFHDSEGPYMPGHYGIAYSSGQRDYTQRLYPPAGNSLHKKYALYGTDCSGFIFNLLKDQGIMIDQGLPLNQVEIDVRNFKQKTSIAFQNNPAYKTFQLCDLGTISPNDIQSGDLIEWFHSTGNHIGLVANVEGETFVYQSNGTSTPLTQIDEEKDWSVARGVHPFTLNWMIAHKNEDFGSNYRILRMYFWGEQIQGGYLFYIGGANGTTGLVAAGDDVNHISWDISPGLLTGNEPIPPNSNVLETSDAIFSGQENTSKIINYLGNGTYAAKYCNDYTINGYSGWYLPSEQEALLFAQNLSANYVTQFSFGAIIWTSTQDPDNPNNAILIVTQYQPYTLSSNKFVNSYARAIRTVSLE